MKTLLRRFTLLVLGGQQSTLLNFFISWRQQLHLNRLKKNLGVDSLERELLQKHGPIIQSGPFKGMSYLERSYGSLLIPKLVGSYEMELHFVINLIAQNPPATILDVGSAEGYYAVGFARLFPSAHIFAFDISPQARNLCRSLSKANSTEQRIDVCGRCDDSTLNKILNPGSLLIMDCEGYEWELLKTEKVNMLTKTNMLVELHHSNLVEAKREFEHRFNRTHTLTFIESQPRNGDEVELPENWSIESRRVALDEMRNGSQLWVWATPKGDTHS